MGEYGGRTQGMEVMHVCDVMGQCVGGKQTQIWMCYMYKRLILKYDNPNLDEVEWNT